jgi:hypothetical protein
LFVSIITTFFSTPHTHLLTPITPFPPPTFLYFHF